MDDVDQQEMETALIITRHAGTVEWLLRRGITGDVVAHVEDPEILRERDVYGVLPLGLAAVADTVSVIDMPGLRPDQRGQELTPEEMDAAGARLRTFIVTDIVDDPEILRGRDVYGVLPIALAAVADTGRTETCQDVCPRCGRPYDRIVGDPWAGPFWFHHPDGRECSWTHTQTELDAAQAASDELLEALRELASPNPVASAILAKLTT